MKTKYDKWLSTEIKTWEEIGLIDVDTSERIKDYYSKKDINEPNKLGALLGVIGSILIGLGIILILAKNWGYFPRSAKAIISLIPFLIGSFGGMFVIKKSFGGWIKESAALFTTIGILTAIVMNGQIYHIVVDEWLLFLIITLLTLPLIYLYDSVPTLAAYLALGSTCMFMTDLISLGIKVGLGVVIIGAVIPYVIKYYRKDKLSVETGWCNVFLVLASFAFITSLAENGVLLRELYIAYFILIVSIDECLYEDNISLRTRPFAMLGNLGLYTALFMFTSSEFWKYVDTSSVGFSHMTIVVILLGTSAAIIVWLIKNKRTFTKRLFIYLIAACLIIFFRLTGLLDNDSRVILPIVLNLFFILLALITLREGIIYSSIGRMNIGLLLLTALIIARFFDSGFSFLVKGIVFIICGIIFLLANLYLTKKRKKEIINV